MRIIGSSINLALVAVCFLSAPCFATDYVTSRELIRQAPITRTKSIPGYVPGYYDELPSTFLDQITMRNYPRGSTHIEYRGLYKPTIKLLYRTYKRFWSQSDRDENNYRRIESLRALERSKQQVWDDFERGGKWWTRSWLESLPEDKGGAPTSPIYNYIGNDVEWKLGPITLTNSLTARIDYIGVFSFEATDQDTLNPLTDQETPEIGHEEALRLRFAAEEVKSFGRLKIKAGIRPHVSIGPPTGGDLKSIVRTIAIKAKAKLFFRGLAIIQAGLQIKIKRLRDLIFCFDVAFVAW